MLKWFIKTLQFPPTIMCVILVEFHVEVEK